MLDNWSGMDKEKAKDYILHCQVCETSASSGDGKRFILSHDCTILDTHVTWTYVCLSVYINVTDILLFPLFFLVLWWWLWISSWCRISWWVETMFYHNLHVILYCEKGCWNVFCHINYGNLVPEFSLFFFNAIVYHMIDLFDICLQ